MFTPPLQQRGQDIRCPRAKKVSRIAPLLDERLDLVRVRLEQLVPALTGYLLIFGAEGNA